ncbi:hypothetical protein T484DRAFT_1907831, partial [Baffinella frigidus]
DPRNQGPPGSLWEGISNPANFDSYTFRISNPANFDSYTFPTWAAQVGQRHCPKEDKRGTKQQWRRSLLSSRTWRHCSSPSLSTRRNKSCSPTSRKSSPPSRPSGPRPKSPCASSAKRRAPRVRLRARAGHDQGRSARFSWRRRAAWRHLRSRNNACAHSAEASAPHPLDAHARSAIVQVDAALRAHRRPASKRTRTHARGNVRVATWRGDGILRV